MGIGEFHSVAFSYNVIFWVVDGCFVMRINYVFPVGHAAVAYFNVVFTD